LLTRRFAICRLADLPICRVTFQLGGQGDNFQRIRNGKADTCWALSAFPLKNPLAVGHPAERLPADLPIRRFADSPIR